MSNTAATVRNAIVDAIEGIYTTLGFDEPPGNVHHGILDFQRDEKEASYLMASMAGKQEVQAWGVLVTDTEEPLGSNNLWLRRFTIQIKGYCEKDINKLNDLINRARLVRNAVRALGTCLGIGIKTIESVGAVDVAEETAESKGGGSLASVSWLYEATEDIRTDED